MGSFDFAAALRALSKPPAIVVALALALCLPAALNGGPFLFWDSDGYYSAGRSIITNLVGDADSVAVEPPAPAETVSSPAGAPAPANLSLTVWSARSPYFGALLFLGTQALGLWGVVLLQAGLAALVLWRTAAAFAPAPTRLFCVMGGAALLTTSLPWFVSFVMPDVWLSLAALLLAALMFARRPPLWFDLALTLTLVAGAATFHTANLLILLIFAPLLAAVAWTLSIERSALMRVLGAALLGLAGALAAGAVLSVAVERHTGEPLRMPIFATARVLADGPGRAYLASACGADAARYTLCRFRDLPLDDSEEILWSSDPALGVYTVADYETRAALSAEQWRFVFGTVAHDPLGQIGAGLANMAEQLSRFSLAEFRINLWTEWASLDWWRNQVILGEVPRAEACLQTPAACAPPPAAAAFDLVQQLAYVLGLVGLAWATWRLKPWRPETSMEDRRLLAFALLLAALCLLNAAICGALSAPNDRYQARLIWVVPVAVAMIATLRWASLKPLARGTPIA